MLPFKTSIYVTTVLWSLLQPALGLEITRDVVFNDPLIDMDVTVDAGFGVSFLSQGSVPISMENNDVANNGVFCLGISKFGTISSGTITNNGQMFLQAKNVGTTQALQATTLINNNFLTFFDNAPVNLSITESFINKGLIYFNYAQDEITIEGPPDGIVNDGVINLYAATYVFISGIVGTGCIILNQANLQEIDVSKPFNQTIYAQRNVPWIHLIGKQLPDSIIVLRSDLWQTQTLELLLGPANNKQAPAYTYNNITGILNMTISKGSFVLDVGPSLNTTLFTSGSCYQTTTDFYPCLGIMANSQAEEPSNCKTNIDINQSSDSLCPRELTLPKPLTTKASYDYNSITKIVSYETTLASDGLPSTVTTTEYFIPSFTLPSPYTTTLVNGGKTITEVVSYFTTTGYISQLPELTTLPFVGTTTRTLSDPFSIPPPYTSTLTEDDMTVSEIISYYSTTGSDGEPATGTTTSTLTATIYITTTVTDYLMGTTHITRDHTSQGTWASLTTYSTEIETYIIRASPTGTGVETLSTISN